jgi:hypothetical protein
MNKIITNLYTAAFSGLISVAGMAPAVADSLVHRDFQEENRYIGDFCDPSSGECVWHAKNSRWIGGAKQSFHRQDREFGGKTTTHLFGSKFDAAVVNALDKSTHHYACKDAHESYDRRSDTYAGQDGSRHLCKIWN